MLYFPHNNNNTDGDDDMPILLSGDKFNRV